MRRDILKIAGVYVAMIIGAGFASGQELIQFFLKYNKNGFLGIILSSFIFFLVAYGVLYIAIKKNYSTQTQFFEGIAGKRFSYIVELLIGFMFLVFYITMIAAAGAAFNQAFGLNFSAGVLIISVFCFAALLYDLEGLVKINSILAPIMFFGGLFIGIYLIVTESTEAFSSTNHFLNLLKDNWVVSAVVYASYNVVTAVSVLISMKSIAKNVKTAKYAAIVSGVSLGLLGIILSVPLFMKLDFVTQFEIPLLAVIYKHGAFMEYFYLIILLMAIFSTAIGNGFAFISFMSSYTKADSKILKIILIAIGIIGAHIGFSTFVGKIYPLFGVVGFIEIIIILFVFFKLRIKTAIK